MRVQAAETIQRPGVAIVSGPMTQFPDDLSAFVSDYERATNSHDAEATAQLIDVDATYWFTDGSYEGLDKIKVALKETFSRIQDETYRISDAECVFATPEYACFRYRFDWNGIVNGVPQHGHGRGTNVVRRSSGGWKVLHEHLSA